MILTHNLRFEIKKYALLETAILIAVFALIGYFINERDPLLIIYEFSYIIVLLSIITLFHGIQNGLFAIFLIALVMKGFYNEFPLESFLKIFVLVLIFGEFHYYWNRQLLHNKSKNDYLSKKLDELSNAFYTLKISHDQLEKNYVFKPMSVRNSIRQLKDAYVDNADYYQNFLILLQKSFNVSEAEFCSLYKGKLYCMQDKEHKDEIGHGDPMIQLALQKKTPIYVSSDEVENNSNYLAVVPVVSQSHVQSVLLIKEMPFMSFNKDNLISISIIISYFLDELSKWELIEASTKNPLVDDDFNFELLRLKKIDDDFDVNSTILVLKSKDKLLAHLIFEKIKDNLRSLDMATSHCVDEVEVIGMLFPFADKASAQGFLVRLLKLLDFNAEDVDLEYSFFDIGELEVAKEYALVQTK
ncbi:MAG: hypothetical protein COA44_01990 [Arcobacter sp.]|nr:MAG: hypothetical protein COA44_01990 [Arcobacter sp.]